MSCHLAFEYQHPRTNSASRSMYARRTDFSFILWVSCQTLLCQRTLTQIIQSEVSLHSTALASSSIPQPMRMTLASVYEPNATTTKLSHCSLRSAPCRWSTIKRTTSTSVIIRWERRARCKQTLAYKVRPSTRKTKTQVANCNHD